MLTASFLLFPIYMRMEGTPNNVEPGNVEISGEFVRSLMELEELRERRKKLEIKSAEIMSRVDQLINEVPEPKRRLGKLRLPN